MRIINSQFYWFCVREVVERLGKDGGSGPGQAASPGFGDRKRAEYRRDDRGYAIGDLLNLREWDPATERYTGFRLTARVTHLARGPAYEIPAGFVVLSVEVLDAAVAT